jgi:hypothetical protein
MADDAAAKSGATAMVPKFVQANNGLGFMAAVRGAGFVTQVIMHFAGLDPPVEWVPPPTAAELFPAWVDEPVAFTGTGSPKCGGVDMNQLAARLQDKSSPPAAEAPSGLLRIETPRIGAADVWDSRAIYGAERRDECLTGG